MQGQQIGSIGATGLGPSNRTEHLHFGVFRLTNTALAYSHDWKEFFDDDASGYPIHRETTAIDVFGWTPACVDPFGRLTTKGALSIGLFTSYPANLDWLHH